MRYLLCVIGTFLLFLAYGFLLLKLEFATIYDPDHMQVYEQNHFAVKRMLYTVPVIGIAWGSRLKLARVGVVLVLLVVWIWPLVQWYLDGAPNPYRIQVG